MNNRQAGRRRGRGGGQRSQGNPSANSRIDSRQRGNANQLYEKYKNLARDAQMSGDRVNTEYYLQFADHYFRVLNENRSRFEENRRQREDAEGDDETDGEDEIGGREAQRYDRDEPRFNGRGNGHAGNDADDSEREPRQAFGRGDRPRRSNGFEEKTADQPVRALEGEPGTEAEALPPKRGRGRPRKERPADEASAAAAAIEADRLPPSLNGGNAATEEKPRRRRGRPPASEAANAAS